MFEFADARNSKIISNSFRLDPICRYRWNDGTIFDASSDIEKTAAEIARIAPDDVENFRRYLADSRQKYEIAERTFLAKSLNDLPNLLRPKFLPDLLKISSMKTLAAHNREYFKSPKLRQIFNRFATYNGSSPYKIPATFALIPHVEFGLGAWYVKGGIYKIPQALEKLARKLNVEFRFDTEVEKIVVVNGRARGVKLKETDFNDGELIESDIVVSNADAVETYRRLIDKKERRIYTDKKLDRREPSCSGFVILLGAKKKFPNLAHHNIFFSDDYAEEFRLIFDVRIPAPDPTIYVCATSKSDATQSPPDCENLFVLVNVPYRTNQVNWRIEAAPYQEMIIKKLEQRGLENLSASVEFAGNITPADFEEIFRANRGSIYGISSNGVFSAFMRIPNKARDIENLYFVGGATHPGGGIPLVLLSGKMAAEMIGDGKTFSKAEARA